MTTPLYHHLYQNVHLEDCDILHQDSLANINSGSSKLRTYALFKNSTGFETYLSDIKNVLVRTKVTKFRLSNHRLMIEVGRHQGIKNEEERRCPFCPLKVENEFHFLFQCSVYKHQRKLFLEPIINHYPGFTYLTQALKIEYMMANMDSNLCNYISNCFDIRDFLEAKPKRSNKSCVRLISGRACGCQSNSFCWF